MLNQVSLNDTSARKERLDTCTEDESEERLVSTVNLPNFKIKEKKVSVITLNAQSMQLSNLLCLQTPDKNVDKTDRASPL